MNWNIELIKYWLEHYYQLREYEINPFEEKRVYMGDVVVTGSQPNLAPFEETCDLNWEFDKALKKLPLLKELYIDGEGRDNKLFKKFCKILMENNDD